jgi:hypothetical protein
VSDEVDNINILIRKEEKYIQGYELQEANVSRPIFAIATFEMAKVPSAMFRDPKLQFSPRLLQIIWNSVPRDWLGGLTFYSSTLSSDPTTGGQ